MPTLIVPILTCKHCGRQYQSSAYQSTYCTMRCKQAASTKRRRLREAGIIPQAPSAVNMDEVSRMADEIIARNKAAAEGRELLADEAPTQLQSTLAELGFTPKKEEGN